MSAALAAAVALALLFQFGQTGALINRRTPARVLRYGRLASTFLVLALALALIGALR